MGKRGEGPAEFNFPTSVAVDDGSLWVGDTLNFRVQRLDLATGRFLDSFGRIGDGPGDMPRGKAVEVDPEGRIWVSDAVLDAVSLFDSGGRLLLSIGAKGSAPGQFSFPAGIAIRPDGVVAVADSLNRRIQILEILPGEGEG
jgi:DNA-binding beta-propeller fold protein YncE